MSRRTTGRPPAPPGAGSPDLAPLVGRRRFLLLDLPASGAPARPAPPSPRRAPARQDDGRSLAAGLEQPRAACAACGRPVDCGAGDLCGDCRFRRALAASFAAGRPGARS